MEPCVFCDIVDGKSPSRCVYEDDHVIAFLDRRMVRPGHSMIIPRVHEDDFLDLPDDLAAHIARVGNAIGRTIRSVLNPRRIGFVVSGFGVAHAHYHVIPLWDENDITSARYVVPSDHPVAFGVDHLPVADGPEQDHLAALLRTDLVPFFGQVSVASNRD